MVLVLGICEYDVELYVVQRSHAGSRLRMQVAAQRLESC